ncbi:MAG: peroxiredoxin-like family protein [Acidobacteriota bacterium]
MTKVIAGAALTLGLSLWTGGDLGAVNRSAIAESAEEICPLLPGMPIPDVSVRDVSGNRVSLQSLVSIRPTVLIFYRGGWCPYCNAQLQQLRRIESDLLALGYQILALSPDPPESLLETRQKGPYDYTLLSDPKLAAARAFGLAFYLPEAVAERYRDAGVTLATPPGEDRAILPVPAVFILRTDGTVVFSYANPDYKVRLHPDLLLAAARLESR